MTLSAHMTVREVATALPQSTRVFERLKIDYCCGGNTPLLEACAKAGVELQDVERLLEETRVSGEPATDLQRASLSALIDYIVEKHHVFTKDEMQRLELLFAKVIAVHGENHPELSEAKALFKRLCADLSPHMFKEEQVLFPYIEKLERSLAYKRPAPFAPFGTVNNPVRMMLMEHDIAGELLRDLRQATNDYALPADACISYRTLYEALIAFEEDLHQHIHLENNILFPRAIEAEELTCRS